jgi:MFS family permease
LNKAWRQLLTREHAANLALVSLGVWLHAADSLVAATLMPSIVEDIGGVQYVAWIFALYEVGSIIAGAGGVYFVYKGGLKFSMASAACVYLIGCCISALAPEMSVMLAGRLIQGFGGGGLVALSFIAVRRLFPLDLLPQVVATISALWGISAFFGPLIGGVFAELNFWRGAFWFFAIQSAGLAIWIGFSLNIKEKSENHNHSDIHFPALRLILIGLGVTAIASGGINVSPLRSSLFVITGFGLLAAFAWLDAKSADSRLFPVRPFDPRGGLGAPLVMVMCFAISTIAITTYGPLIMTTIYDISPLSAGYIIALASIGWSVSAVVSANAARHHDGQLILAGMITLTLSILGFMIVMPNGPFWLIPVFALAEGAGFGMAWTFVLRRAESISAPADRDRLAGALPTVHRLGYAIGAAIIGIAANAAGFSHGVNLATAQSAGFWVFAISLPFAGLGLFAAWRFVHQ